MLGRFLEFSLATPDIRASLDFYVKLGFSHAEAGEAWSHPYAVVTDGRICVGLHNHAQFAPSVTFVKPELLRHLEGFEKSGAVFEFRHLGNDVFNEVGWLDPAGHMVRLLEARTFSPSKRSDLDISLCGYFVELALPTPDLELGKAFWERHGFVGMDEPNASLPHIACTSDTIDIGLYDSAQLQAPTLLFEVDDLRKTMANLGAGGITAAGRVPAPLRGRAAMLHAPEGTAILLVAADAWSAG